MKEKLLFYFINSKSIGLLMALVMGISFAQAQNVNLAPQATPTASTCNTGACTTLNDLNYGTCGTQQMWITSSATNPGSSIFVQFTWTSAKTIKGLTIHAGGTGTRYLTGGTIQVLNGSTWTTAIAFTQANTALCNYDINFPPVSGSALRIIDMTVGGSQTSNVNFREIEIWQGSTANNDVGVSSIDTPGVFCTNFQNIYATVTNFGKNQVTGFNVNWSINGTLQTPITSSASLDTSGGVGPNTTQVMLGSYTFPSSVLTAVKAWTSSPNSVADTVTNNDTSSVVRMPAFPGGTYTINGTAGPNNFATIDAAIAAMTPAGICGPIVFNIAPGTYTRTTAITIPAIAGASNINTITFNGQNKNTCIIEGSIASSGIFVLNAARYVKLRNMTVNNTNATSPCAIAAVGSTRGIGITNVIARVPVQTSTSSTGYVINFTGSVNGSGVAAAAYDSVTIDSCRTVGGGYGIVTYGSSVASANSGIVITNNTIDSCNYMGGYIAYNYNPIVMRNNIINMQGWNYGYYGLYFYYNQSGNLTVSHEIINNRINNYGYYGIYLYYPQSVATAAKVKVYNNIVSSNNSGSYTGYYGIYFYSFNAACNADFYHNTILMNGAQTANTSTCLYNTGSTVVNIKNNIFAVYSGASTPLYLATAPAGNTVNFNNYYNATATTANLVYRGAFYNNTTFKTATTGGDSSANNAPSFTNRLATPYANLSLANGCDAIGTNLTADVPADFIGVTRSTSTPNPGAYEFTGGSANNLAVQSLITPAAPIVAGAQDLVFKVKNIGNNTIYSYNASYKLNNNTPVTVAMTTNSIAPCMEDTAFFTSGNQITLGSVNNIAIYTDGPNASLDFDRTNDTLRATFFAPLNGTYTVGGTTPDFATPVIAAAALSNGVSGPVVFDIRPGTYTGQVAITGSVAGISATNTVTFKGQNKATTIITGSVAGSVFLINQINYITVRDLTITNTSATTPTGFGVVGTSTSTNGKGTKIINCNVNVPILSGTSSVGYGIIFTGTANATGLSAMGADSVLVDSCTITGGGYTLVCYGSSNAAYNRGNVFTNNTINNSNYMGGYIAYQYNPIVVDNNTFNMQGQNYGYYGLYFYYNQNNLATQGHVITRNRINTFGYYGIYLYYPQLASGAATLCANNAINGNSPSSSYPGFYGIYLYQAGAFNANVLHNTIVMSGGATSTSATCLFNTGSAVTNIKNNIFSVTAGAYTPLYLSTALTGNTANYNQYWNGTNVTTGNLVFRGAFFNPTNYKTATAGGDSSFNAAPIFASSTNLAITNGCTRGVTTNGLVNVDNLNNARNLTNPNVGAFEYQGVALDLFAEAMPYPATPITLGAQDLAVRVRNNGTTAVTSFDVSYRLNNGTPKVYNWTGILASCDTTTVVFTGANQITLGTATNNIKVYTSNPNFSADGNRANDTISVSLNPPMIGTYVIGAAPSDFTTFAAADAALLNRGIAGAVIFNVKTGTYNEQVTLDPTIGASATNTITFKSLANNADSVIITNNASYVLKFNNNANYYVLDRMTINQTDPLNSYYTVTLGSTASFDTIRNCKVGGVVYGTVGTPSSYMIYATGYVGNGLALINNIFNGTYYGLYLQGSSQTAPMKNPYIVGNTFNNFYYSPWYYFYYTNGAQVLNNTYNVMTNSSATMYMYHYYADSGYQCRNNVYNGLSGKTQYYYMYYSYSTVAKPSVIANNRFGTNGQTMYIYTGSTPTANQYIAHNTFNVGIGYFYYSYSTAQVNMRVLNNIFNGTGVNSYYISALPSSLYLNSNNNLVFSTTSTTPYYAGANYSLAALKAVAPGIETNSLTYRAALTSTTNFTPLASDTAVWAINGRGTHLPFALNDVNNVVRPLTPAAGVPDLGAIEVTPTAIAPLATAIPAAPVAGTTQVFTFGGDTVAKITYDAFANVPTAVGIRQYTGVRHPMAGATQNYTNVYNATTANGPGSYFFDYKMYYKDAMLGTNPSETDLRSSRYANSYWNNYTGTGSTVDSIANIITSIGMSDFGDYIGTDNNTPLPVRLTAFGAKANGKNALVSWTTASEKNANFFEVYASNDGRNFKAIDKVRAAGNSSVTKNYSINHMGALANASIVYYKLKSVDFDGTFTWSNIVSVSLNTRNNGVAVYPNPFNNNLTISVTETADATVEIFTLQGVSVYHNNHSAVNGTITLNNVSSLNNGVYFIKVTQNGNTTVEKLVKQ